jgi:hypothetical protein
MTYPLWLAAQLRSTAVQEDDWLAVVQVTYGSGEQFAVQVAFSMPALASRDRAESPRSAAISGDAPVWAPTAAPVKTRQHRRVTALFIEISPLKVVSPHP